jgi:hypothetical protein
MCNKPLPQKIQMSNRMITMIANTVPMPMYTSLPPCLIARHRLGKASGALCR